LICLLNLLKLATESWVFDERFQLAEIIQLFDPAIANGPGDQAGESRIVRYHESARRHPVSDVEKLLGPELKKVMQGCLLQELGMQFGHTIDFMATDRSQISHPDISFAALINERHSGDA